MKFLLIFGLDGLKTFITTQKYKSINDPFLEKLEKYKPDQNRIYRGFGGANKRTTFLAVEEVEDEDNDKNEEVS